jgi:predicted TIM-barrel enzyme
MAHAGAVAQVHHGTLIRCNGLADDAVAPNGILTEKARALR